MTDGPALLAAIIAQPDEDTPRLMYADWCDENGQPDRAEFIRVQVELARLMTRRGNTRKIDKLLKRERKLFYGKAPEGAIGDGAWEWFHKDLPRLGGDGIPPGYYHKPERGFVAHVTCSAADWLAHGDRIREVQPVNRVTLTTRPDVAGDEAGDREPWSELIDTGDDEGRFRVCGREVVVPVGGGPKSLLEARWPRVTFEVPPHHFSEYVDLARADILRRLSVPAELLAQSAGINYAALVQDRMMADGEVFIDPQTGEIVDPAR